MYETSGYKFLALIKVDKFVTNKNTRYADEVLLPVVRGRGHSESRVNNSDI